MGIRDTAGVAYLDLICFNITYRGGTSSSNRGPKAPLGIVDRSLQCIGRVTIESAVDRIDSAILLRFGVSSASDCIHAASLGIVTGPCEAVECETENENDKRE